MSSSLHRSIFASGRFTMDEGTAFPPPHSPAAAARLMRLGSAPGTSTQEEMGPISLLFSPKRDIHLSSHGITCVSVSKSNNKHTLKKKKKKVGGKKGEGLFTIRLVGVVKVTGERERERARSYFC